MKAIMKIYGLLALLTISLWSCHENEFREPLENDGTVPPGVLNATSEAQAGAVVVSYSLPNDDNISHVVAKYKLSSGKDWMVKASIYADNLLLEGFADTVDHEVKLHTVTKSNVESEAVTINVRAKEAPIWKVRKSIKFIDAFGGYNMLGDNIHEKLVTIFVMDINEFGEFEVDNLKSFTTVLPNVASKIRGLDTLTYTYKYFIMDRLGNTTDTVTVDVNPLYETEIPKSGFKPYVLTGDAPQVTNGTSLQFAWDGRLGWPYTSFTYQSAGGSGPHRVTVDMGIEAKLSRFWYRPYPELWWNGDEATQWFYLTTMKRFEIYGSTEPNPTGVIDESWILLGAFEVIKPSGSPVGQDTPEDKAFAERGMDFELDVNAPKVRFVRIVCLENWGGGTAQNINELAFYGDPR